MNKIKKKKDKLVCPFCGAEIKKMPKGLEIKRIAMVCKQVVKQA